MSYLFQISDPEELRVTIQIPGKFYNPDMLEDGKNRLVSAYQDALEARLVAARKELELRVEFETEDEESDA